MRKCFVGLKGWVWEKIVDKGGKVGKGLIIEIFERYVEVFVYC